MPKTPPKKEKLSIPLKQRDLPATLGFVDEVRKELKAEIRTLDHKIDSLDHKIDSVQSRVSAQIQQVLAAVHRTQALMEEQHGDNKIVMDGLKNLRERQDQVEVDVAEIKQTVTSLAKAKRSPNVSQ